jgi:ATP-dependent helicase IRC3
LYAQCVGRGTRIFPGKPDCLILDFVDLTSLSLCTLPSLFGVPRDLDLRGGDASEARRIWQGIEFDRPGFEVEAGALTLAEIQDRAAGFDPLTLRPAGDVRAISGNAWFSLGRHGVGLHFEARPGQPSEALVRKIAGRGKTWEVTMDGKAMERFLRLEDAVEAVDFEIQSLGRGAELSARPDSPWRLAVNSQEGAMTRGEALQLAVWRRFHPLRPGP